MYVNDSLANTSGISTEIIKQFQEIFEEVKENVWQDPMFECYVMVGENSN